MPLALLTRPLQACVLVLAALLAVTAYAGPAQDFAAADNGGRAHLLEHWAATPDADRLAFLEALRHNRIALDSRQQPFILGADQRFQAAEGDALPDGEPKPLRLNNRLRGLLNTALASTSWWPTKCRCGRPPRSSCRKPPRPRNGRCSKRACGSRATLA